MNIKTAFPSDWLRAADLAGREHTVTVERIELEVIGDGGEEKPVIRFQGRRAGLVLNKTNAAEIAAAFGDETDQWQGRDLVLYTGRTNFRGQSVECIRVRVPTQPAEAATVAGPAGGTADLDDDIPF